MTIYKFEDFTYDGAMKIEQGGIACLEERNIYVQTVKQGRFHTSWIITRKRVRIYPVMRRISAIIMSLLKQRKKQSWIKYWMCLLHGNETEFVIVLKG